MIRLVPVTLKDAKGIVSKWHSHHKAMVGHLWTTGAVLDDDSPAGIVVVSMPIAEANRDGFTYEVTRLCSMGEPGDPRTKNVASRLLGAATSASEARGIRLVLSYTRVDEDGTCYRAAGWVPCADLVKARDWTSGSARTRWLPGFYEPTTEKIERVRWEWRPPQAIRAVCKCIAAMGRWAVMWREHQQRKAA